VKVIFYDDPYVPENKKGLERKLAKMPGVQGVLRSTAYEGAGRARSVLRAHKHDGDSRIKVQHGDVDYHVILTDEAGQRAAAAIEVGTGRSQGVWALHRAFALGGFTGGDR
jgi:hypothetical protein